MHELVERDGEVVDYRTLQVNAAFERQSGLSAEQVCGRSAGELSASGRAPRLDEYAWVVASGEPFDFETWVEETQCHLTVRAVALGGARFATVSGDVTERRRADADLRRAGELAGIAAQERRRAEEQRAHVAAELRRLADESASVGEELRGRQAALGVREAALDVRQARSTLVMIAHRPPTRRSVPAATTWTRVRGRSVPPTRRFRRGAPPRRRPRNVAAAERPISSPNVSSSARSSTPSTGCCARTSAWTR